MSLFDFMLTVDEPLTAASIAEAYGHPLDEVEAGLETLLAENSIRKRVFKSKDGSDVAIFWSPRIIPYADQTPIITSPFSDPYDHKQTMERLNDQQITQEKIWLQTKIRKLKSEYENLTHRSRHKFTQKDEDELDDVIKRWVTVCQDSLTDLRNKLRDNGTNMTMNDLIKNLQIDPELVHWDPEEEDFV